MGGGGGGGGGRETLCYRVDFNLHKESSYQINPLSPSIKFQILL